MKPDITETCLRDQKLYHVPLYEMKDGYSMLSWHVDDGYIVVGACQDPTDGQSIKEPKLQLIYQNIARTKLASVKLRDQLISDGFTIFPVVCKRSIHCVDILETHFIIYVDKRDMNNNDAKYKCSFGELIEYGKNLCDMFNQRCFSVQYPNNARRVQMDCRGNIVKSFDNVEYNSMSYFDTTVRMSVIGDRGFYAPSCHLSPAEKVLFYEFPCDIHYRYIKWHDGIVSL